MGATQFEFILYCKDQERSKQFYSAVLACEPVLNVPGMTEFQLTQTVKLGLMPEAGIATILGEHTPHPATGNGIPRCEVYMIVEQVADAYERAVASGARPVSEPSARDWGDTVGYVADPDGHILALAEPTAGSQQSG